MQSPSTAQVGAACVLAVSWLRYPAHHRRPRSTTSVQAAGSDQGDADNAVAVRRHELLGLLLRREQHRERGVLRGRQVQLLARAGGAADVADAAFVAELVRARLRVTEP